MILPSHIFEKLDSSLKLTKSMVLDMRTLRDYNIELYDYFNEGDIIHGEDAKFYILLSKDMVISHEVVDERSLEGRDDGYFQLKLDEISPSGSSLYRLYGTNSSAERLIHTIDAGSLGFGVGNNLLKVESLNGMYFYAVVIE